MAEQPVQERKKTSKEAAADHAPWKPTPWTPADAISIQRLSTGTATPDEQRRAFAWILLATGYQDEPYRPGGEDGRRETDFALGKANVGRQIAKLVKLHLGKLLGGEHGEHG